ncbi:MAG: hypothetical protein Q9162_000711 [Coniocarpon cinnabarinum]
MDLLKRLGDYLDRPLFPWKRLVIGFSVGQYVLQTYLSYRQYRVLCGKTRPKALEAEVDQKTFDKSQEYGRAKSRFGFISGLFSQVLDIAVLQYDLFPKIWGITGIWVARFAPAWCSGEITQSLVFGFAYSIFTTILGLPFDYYYHFVLEEKFGFNKQTLNLWLMDLLKGQALGIAFGVPIGSAFLAIIQKTGDQFFYYVYLFAFAVQVLMITIYPIVIVPLFNKLTPLPQGDLRAAVEKLAGGLQFPLTELQVIDGSKRSAHSNAYFTGLPGMKKKIVLFDTLLEKSEEKEVVAVLGHELGHWKMNHTSKQLGIAQVHLFAMFALFSAFVHNRSLYQSFGFHKEQPIIIGFMLFNEILAPTDSVLRLLMNIMSRNFEFQADAFGAKLGYSKELASSLIKLQIQNLSAMDADWMYSAYTYSHPILTERLRALGYKSEVKVSSDKPKDSEKEDGVAKASGTDLKS